MDVMEEVMSIKLVWYRLGEWLRLQDDDLDAIQDTYPNPNERDSKRALKKVLLLWLQKKYNVEKFGLPTWKMLVIAVDKKTGGNDQELAKEIASRHPKGILYIEYKGALPLHSSVTWSACSYCACHQQQN